MCGYQVGKRDFEYYNEIDMKEYKVIGHLLLAWPITTLKFS